MNNKNPRTKKIINITGRSVRLSVADRGFLKDLSKVQIISTDVADKWHYAHQQAGAKNSLSRLVDAKILQEKNLHTPKGIIKIFQFASHEVAKSWGGRLPVTGAKRTELHELVTSRLYFELGRPDDFRLENRFSDDDKFICGQVRPDAMYTNYSGDTVFVEADSGQYSKAQIKTKANRWTSLGYKQVWGQPREVSSATVPVGEMISTLTV